LQQPEPEIAKTPPTLIDPALGPPCFNLQNHAIPEPNVLIRKGEQDIADFDRSEFARIASLRLSVRDEYRILYANRIEL
jgi:hypothetical protein